MFRRNRRNKRNRRRGTVAVLTAVSLVVLMGFAALAVDVGMLYNAREESQRTADSAALAGAWELLDGDALTGTAEMSEESLAARQRAATFAAANPILGHAPVVDLNSANSPEGDVLIGYIADANHYIGTMSTANPDQANSVRVLVRRDSVRNGPILLAFANILGIESTEVWAEATATFKDGVVGYRANSSTGNAQLLPFALHVNVWNALLAGTYSVGDGYSYNTETGAVAAGADGVRELNLYPGSGGTQLPPGNFGTVDVGSASNSTADIARQILQGVNESDLSYFPNGELKLGPDGTLPLEGDTGLSAGMKDELEAIKGQARAILLFNAVSGSGNNAVYTIVGFAGIRIVDVKLTGSMSGKRVIIQPAFVVDDSAITGSGPGSSKFVYEPPRLVR